MVTKQYIDHLHDKYMESKQTLRKYLFETVREIIMRYGRRTQDVTGVIEFDLDLDKFLNHTYQGKTDMPFMHCAYSPDNVNYLRLCTINGDDVISACWRNDSAKTVIENFDGVDDEVTDIRELYNWLIDNGNNKIQED